MYPFYCGFCHKMLLRTCLPPQHLVPVQVSGEGKLSCAPAVPSSVPTRISDKERPLGALKVQSAGQMLGLAQPSMLCAQQGHQGLQMSKALGSFGW